MDIDNELKQLFDGFDPNTYEREAEQRWGNTEAYRESKRRTASYKAEDWARYKQDDASLMAELVAALHAGKAPDDPAVMDLAEQHRMLIDRWFYACSKEMHRGLADMYASDARFAQNIDKHGVGLTPFLSAAIRANAERS